MNTSNYLRANQMDEAPRQEWFAPKTRALITAGDASLLIVTVDG